MHPHPRSALLGLASLALVLPTPGSAQPPVVSVPLTQTEYVFATAEQPKIRVTVVVKGLQSPWTVAFLPSGDALVTERGERLRLVRNAIAGGAGKNATLVAEPIGGLPTLPKSAFKGGLHEVLLHPQFAENGFVYLTFNISGPGTPPASAPAADRSRPAPQQHFLAIVRGKLTDHALTNVQEISRLPAVPAGIRMAFGRDGMLYVATGTMFDQMEPQRLDEASGKVLRLTPDGKAAADNPFVGRSDVLPEIYSYGHSTQYGLAVHPVTGALLSTDNGPNGGDEVNLILPGRNYGWPLVSYGRKENGEPYPSAVADGVERPLIVWLPGIVPHGLVVYSGRRIPAWRGNLFVGSAHRGRMRGTGGVERVVVDDKLGDVRREMLLTELQQRIRDVREGPDGLLYVLTDGADAALLRIEPAS
jgi:glucose/arabinose dehydrogenase